MQRIKRNPENTPVHTHGESNTEYESTHMNRDTWEHTLPHLMAAFPWWICWCDIFSLLCGEGCHGDALLWQYVFVGIFVCVRYVFASFFDFDLSVLNACFCFHVVYVHSSFYEQLCFCKLIFCVCLCVCASCVLVGSVQGAPGVWAHVRPVVGRPPGRLWQWKDPRVLWPQHSQGLLLFLQVQDKITPHKLHDDTNKGKYYIRVLTAYFRKKIHFNWKSGSLDTVDPCAQAQHY